jgi:hypothetical protein
MANVGKVCKNTLVLDLHHKQDLMLKSTLESILKLLQEANSAHLKLALLLNLLILSNQLKFKEIKFKSKNKIFK